MENVLALQINDIELFINAFSETLIDASRDTERPEVYVRINLEENDPALVANLMNIDKIEHLALKKDDRVIWTSEKYTLISKLSLDIMDTLNEYVIVIV